MWSKYTLPKNIALYGSIVRFEYINSVSFSNWVILDRATIVIKQLFEVYMK